MHEEGLSTHKMQLCMIVVRGK